MLFKLNRPVSLNERGHTETKSNIINLSHHFRPNSHQIELLEKGLSFIPTLDIHKQQNQTLRKDVTSYHRRLKLATHFDRTEDEEIPRFQPASLWEPKAKDVPNSLKELIQLDRITIQELPGQIKEKQNINRDQVRALKSLSQNQDIIIKPADKGSSIVIMDREQYVQEGMRQLNNTAHYMPLDAPIYHQTAIDTKRIFKKLREKKIIDHKQERYLLGQSNPRPRFLYLLPKIHKKPESWTVPFEIPPGRPIVSDINSETYGSAEFIEYYLNPLSVKHPSYVKDSYDFIEKVKMMAIPQDALLCSIDIDSLYTNINTAAGMTAIKEIFKKYPDRHRPDAELLELLEINLTKNDFEFDGKTFLQTSGTAMGKRFAPSYANIYMALWEETALQKCRLKPTQYLRYLDDIFCIWTHSMEEFDEFIRVLNTHHNSITVKCVTSKEHIDFLDTTVYKGPDFNNSGRLDLKVFFKETDTHALLHKTSFHPNHCFAGIVKSQLLRFKRICTQETDFKNACKILFSALRKRGYTRTFLRKAARTFHLVKVRDTRPKIPLVTNYSSLSLLANTRMKANFENREDNLLEEFTIISAYRRNKNLQDYLVHSRLKSQNQTRRDTPNYYVPKELVKNRISGEVFTIKQKIPYNTPNCVYLISCTTCNLQYVGQTKNKLNDRLNQHRYNINNRKQTSLLIVQHFIQHGIESLNISGLEYNPHWTCGQRKFQEVEWINRLETRHPQGLNFQTS